MGYMSYSVLVQIYSTSHIGHGSNQKAVGYANNFQVSIVLIDLSCQLVIVLCRVNSWVGVLISFLLLQLE